MFLRSSSSSRGSLAAALLVAAVAAAGVGVGSVAHANTIVSDQFTGAAGNPASIWTLSAPTGNSNGTSTAQLDGNGNLLMNVPAGSDAWINNRSYAPFLTQAIPSGEPTNYEIDTEVLMNGGTYKSATIGGLIVLGTTNGTSYNGNTYPFTLSLGLQDNQYGGISIQLQTPGNGVDENVTLPISAASSPVYLQLVRDGTSGTWTANYSLTSPSSWTSLGLPVTDTQLNGQNATSVGLFSKAWTGNSAGTASFNYFNSSAVPEPATFGLFVVAGAGLLLIGRKRALGLR